MSDFFVSGEGNGSGNLGTVSGPVYVAFPGRQEACTRKAACVVLDEEDQPQAGLAQPNVTHGLWWQLKDFLCSPRKLGKMNPI